MADEPRKTVNLDKDLLAILCCPDTKQSVVLADDSLIQKLNAAIGRGELKNKAKKNVTERLDGGLIRTDNKILYPVREDIPVMPIGLAPEISVIPPVLRCEEGERSGLEEARIRSLGFRLRAGRSAAVSAQILIQIAGGKD